MVFAQLCICLFPLTADTSDEMRALIEKHQHYLDHIHTLQVEVQATFSEDGGRTWKPMARITWRKDGTRHRFTRNLYSYGTSAGAQGSVDRNYNHEVYIDPDEFREVMMPDPPIPEPLGPKNGYGRVRAGIAESPRWISNRGPPLWLFFTADGMFSLFELERLASDKKLLGKVTIEGRELLGIELTNPENRLTAIVYLDPLRNYAITRREVSVPSDAATSAGSKGVHRVLESKEIKPGIHFPMHIQTSSSDQPPSMLDVRVLSVKINEPIPEEAFRIEIPRGAKVKNSKTREVYIWGDGAPALTFTDPDRFQQWELAQMGSGPGQTVTKFVAINVAFFALIVLIAVMRRRYTHKLRPA